MNVFSHLRRLGANLSAAARLRLAGFALLACGLPWAAWVWLTAPAMSDAAIPFSRRQVEVRQLEIIGGKFAVVAADLSNWFDGLWVGRSLGVTLAVLTVAGALFLFWIATWAAIDPGAGGRD